MYHSLNRSIKSSPDSKKLPVEDGYERRHEPPSVHDRHDRVNNLQEKGTTKRKRIRGKIGLKVMNNLVSDSKSSRDIDTKNKRTKLERISSRERTPFNSLSPQKSVASSPIRDVSSLLDLFEKSSNGKPNKSNETDSESESDIDGSLIEVGKFSSSPVKRRDSAWDKMDKMIEPLPNSTRRSIEGKVDNFTGDGKNLASMVASGDFLSTIEKKRKLSKDEIALKYGSKSYPDPIISKKLLSQKCLEHISIVPLILKGKLHTCYLYPLAKRKSIASQHETMTQAEKFEINWSNFFGGYYGFQRQSFIASIIMNKYDLELRQANRTNKVVTYWTINGFATFILANEIILRMIMKDFGDCSLERAEEIMRDSTEYGIEVADEIDMIDDLGKDDPLNSESANFMKGLSNGGEIKGEISDEPKHRINDNVLDQITKAESESESDSELEPNFDTEGETKRIEEKSKSLDILDKIVDSDSDSDSN